MSASSLFAAITVLSVCSLAVSQPPTSCTVSCFNVQQNFNPQKYFTGTWHELRYIGINSLPINQYFVDYRQDFSSYDQKTGSATLTQRYRIGSSTSNCVVRSKDKLVQTGQAVGKYNLNEAIGQNVTVTPFWVMYTDYSIAVIYGCGQVNQTSGYCVDGFQEVSVWSRQPIALNPSQNATVTLQLKRLCLKRNLVNTDHTHDCGPASGSVRTFTGLQILLLTVLCQLFHYTLEDFYL